MTLCEINETKKDKYHTNPLRCASHTDAAEASVDRELEVEDSSGKRDGERSTRQRCEVTVGAGDSATAQES